VLETHGQRLYWLCCVLAVIFIGIGVWFYTVGGIGQVDGVMMAIAYAVIACGFLDDRSRFPICLLVRKRPSLRNNNKAIASTCPLWVKSGHYAVQPPCPALPLSGHARIRGASSLGLTVP
jgi:hypothetical protein